MSSKEQNLWHKSSTILRIICAPHGSFHAAEFAVVGLLSKDESRQSPGSDDTASSSGNYAPVDDQLRATTLWVFGPIA